MENEVSFRSAEFVLVYILQNVAQTPYIPSLLEYFLIDFLALSY